MHSYIRTFSPHTETLIKETGSIIVQSDKRNNEELHLHYLALAKKCMRSVERLERIVKDIFGNIEPSYAYIGDIRFKKLSEDIKSLEDSLSTFREISNNGNYRLGLLSTDKVFEYYSYSIIVETLLKNDFKITSTSEELPHAVNFFVKLKRSIDNLSITIFHDQPILVDQREGDFHPLRDSIQRGAPLRPDFLLVFQINGNEAVAIIDAKYKEQSRKFETEHFKKITSLNIAAKYGQGF